MNLALLCRRMIFTQVLLGIVAFCTAEKNPGLLLVAGAIGAMSWYLTEGPRGRALPRWVVNAGALVASAWLAFALLSQRSHVVLAMGHFTMILQLLMLYARKTDREYSQLLVLSLLQMISASVLSVSMIYGLFLAAYCAVALTTILLFHLTTSANAVGAAGAKALGQPHRPPVRDDTMGPELRRQLRRVTVVLGLVCVTIAAAVFMVMPRTGKSGLDFRPRTAAGAVQTGFSTSIRLGAGPLGTGSREPVMHLSVGFAGQPIGHDGESWLVRGAALDYYDPQSYVWQRSNYANASEAVFSLDRLSHWVRDNVRPREPLYTASIALRDARPRTIFSVSPEPQTRRTPSFVLADFRSPTYDGLLFSPLDQQLQAAETDVAAVEYRIAWSSRVTPLRESQRWVHPWDSSVARQSSSPEQTRRWMWRWGSRPPVTPDSTENRYDYGQQIDASTYARRWSVQPQRVREYALRILDEAGLTRDPTARSSPDDLKIAEAFTRHLSRRFTYDLQNPRPRNGQDPVIQFLFDRRRGHCELFAAGLAALCRSVNVPARLVTGFRASEFNDLGGYYIVRQSNAHAWTEVFNEEDGAWYTFDATPAEPLQAEHRAPGGWLAGFRQLYEHIEFAWIKRVVAFDSRSRDQVLKQVSSSWDASRRSGQSLWSRLIELGEDLADRLALGRLEWLVVGLIGVGLAVAAAILLRIGLVRRRRRRRLQLTRLPPDRRRTLHRDLGFYLTMLDMLERHGQTRPRWQSPHQFVTELATQQPERFADTVPLTEIFYRLRFGQHTLDRDAADQIRRHLRSLEQRIAERRL
jgi:transglutaminase-like putative cysteine protease